MPPTAAAYTKPGPGDPPLPERHRIVYSNVFGLRLNPLGLEDRFSIGYRYRLYDNPGALYRDANIHVAFTPVLNPAATRLGAIFEVQPLSVLKLRVGYGFLGFFGTFQFVQSYQSPLADFSDTQLKRDRDAGTNYATTGGQAELGALLQAKVGPIAIRNEVTFLRYDMNLRGTDDVFYDMRIDALVPKNGWALTNDSDLVYISKFGLAAGVRGSVVHAFYDEGVYQRGEPIEDPNGPMFRLGPLAAYTFSDKPGAAFTKPTILVLANWWLTHRWRTGADVSQAIPYTIIAFSFSGDLAAWK